MTEPILSPSSIAPSLRARNARVGLWPTSAGTEPPDEVCAVPSVLPTSLDFGDPDAETAAIGDAVGLIALPGATVLEVAGADAAAFLHNVTSQGAKDLPVGGGAPGLIMTPKGRIVAEVTIVRAGAERFLLLGEPGLAERTAAWLDRYIIMEDVRLTDLSAEHVLVSIQGPKAPAVLEDLGLGSLPAPGGAVLAPSLGEVAVTLVLARDRTGRGGWDVLVGVEAASAAFDALAGAVERQGGRPCGADALDRHRVAAALPVYGRDFGPQSLPQEVGLEQSHLDWEKGCYIGQEVVSRLKFRGHTNRSLERVAFDGEALPEVGARVQWQARDVGWVTSVARAPGTSAVIGMAMLHRDARAPGTVLDIGSGDAARTATVVAGPSDEAAS